MNKGDKAKVTSENLGDLVDRTGIVTETNKKLLFGYDLTLEIDGDEYLFTFDEVELC